MHEGITTTGELTIGLDLGDRFTEGRLLDGSGEVVESFRIRTTELALRARLASCPRSRVVLEMGTHSPWVSRCVASLGHETIVANPRRLRLIAENDSKSDGVDAELLARLGRADPSLLKPIVHRGLEAQRDRILIQARNGFVRARTPAGEPGAWLREGAGDARVVELDGSVPGASAGDDSHGRLPRPRDAARHDRATDGDDPADGPGGGVAV